MGPRENLLNGAEGRARELRAELRAARLADALEEALAEWSLCFDEPFDPPSASLVIDRLRGVLKGNE
jgi:hypothetical protein